MATKKAAPKKAAVKKSAVKKSPSKKSAVKKAAPRKSNLDRLVAADVISQESVGQQDKAVINKLSAAEVNTLIKLRKKMGAAPLMTGGSGGGSRPNFPV